MENPRTGNRNKKRFGHEVAHFVLFRAMNETNRMLINQSKQFELDSHCFCRITSLVRILLEKIAYPSEVLQNVAPIRERKELVGQGEFFLF